jgi:Fe-S-cluster-containing hydrogenase component 2
METDGRMIVVENPDACTGCLLCEMACSFHHTGKYSRHGSSIRVNKSISSPEKGPQVTVSYGKETWNPVCNLCTGEDSPLCIRFCPENVLALEGVHS